MKGFRATNPIGLGALNVWLVFWALLGASAASQSPPQSPTLDPPAVVRRDAEVPRHALGAEAIGPYSHGEPTAEEQYMLELINRARANPPAEGLRLQATTDPDILSAYSYFQVDLAKLVADFAGYPARPPLAFNAALLAAARGHSQDMAVNDFQGHTGSNGSSMTTRIETAGYTGWNALAENVFAYSKSVFHGHAGFNVDWGVPSLGHRSNIMNFSASGAVYTEIGIGIVPETSPGTGVGPLVVTEDFGRRSGELFVVGVVYHDKDRDGFYGIGEGLAGITVTTTQGNYAYTSASGGYAIPLAGSSGSIVVRAEGGALGTAREYSVSLAGTNVKVDFVVATTSDQSINFGAAPTIAVGGSGTVTATATSGLAVTFSSLTPGVCAVVGNIVTGVTTGTCTIAADQGGSGNYNPAPRVTQSFGIGKVNQSVLTVGATPSSFVYGGTSTLSTTGGSGTGSVSYLVVVGPCSVSGNTLTAIGVGPCTVTATKAGDSTYNDASATIVVTIGKANQTVTFGATPSVGVGGSSTMSASATSGLAVTFGSLTPAVCTVVGKTDTGITTGTSTIAADQTGNTNYNPAPRVTQSFGVLPPNSVLLDVTHAGTGIGTVSSNPAGIACSADCSELYARGTTVTLTATPLAGSAFGGWGGGCTGTGVCAAILSGNVHVTATFVYVGSAHSRDYVQKAYIAYYGRPADPAGQAYWAGRMDAEGGSLNAIIGAFGNSDEFNRRYGGLSYRDLVTRIYRQALGRDPDQAGLDWYVNELAAGRRTLQTITLDVLNGATTAPDSVVVANKLDLGAYYTAKVAAGCPYGTAQDGMSVISAVSDDAATVAAAKSAIDSRCGR